MTELFDQDRAASSSAVSRRKFLRDLGAGGLAVVAAPHLSRASLGGPTLLRQPSVAGAPPAQQLHLQFGADASRSIVASWATSTSVRRPRLRLGTPDHGYGTTIGALTRTYIDAKSGTEVFTHHAAMDGLRPASAYVYEVLHDGAAPLAGSFTTGPRGRAPFRFTSFGDQATPVAGDGLASPYAGYVVDQVESVEPLFHLLNGDLCYANISPDRPRAWADFFTNNMRSARYRPWMPAAGNHENELGNGPYGFGAYQTRFFLPDNHEQVTFRGLWYAFTVGSVRVISINNDDVCYQDGGDSYIRGYSDGAQRRWLEQALAAARSDPHVDWVVVCSHQVVISSAHNFNGCDRGIREEFVPLFDRYGVDLVVAGHEHHYERTYPLRGVVPGSATLQPRVVTEQATVIDTSKGTVHMIIGGGGTSAPSDMVLGDTAYVTIGVGPRPAGGGHRPSIQLTEPTAWSAFRDPHHAYGFVAFDVDPGVPGGLTQLHATYYLTTDPSTSGPVPFERFTLQRPRSDRPQAAAANRHAAAVVG